MTALEWLGSRRLTFAGCVVVAAVTLVAAAYSIGQAVRRRKCWRF